MGDLATTPIAAPSTEASDVAATELTAAAPLDAAAAVSSRLADLVIEATELDELAASLRRRETVLDRLELEVAEAARSNAAEADRLAQHNMALGAEAAGLRVRESFLEQREAVLEVAQQELVEQAHELEARAARFHWRWLLRAWAWRPRLPGRKARLCELLFVSSPDGYRLLDQDGMALTPRARLTGLLDERRTYVVTKIAPWPLDGRWCAYLEQDDRHPRRK